MRTKPDSQFIRHFWHILEKSDRIKLVFREREIQKYFFEFDLVDILF